jgi:hypothetical protein
LARYQGGALLQIRKPGLWVASKLDSIVSLGPHYLCDSFPAKPAEPFKRAIFDELKKTLRILEKALYRCG